MTDLNRQFRVGVFPLAELAVRLGHVYQSDKPEIVHPPGGPGRATALVMSAFSRQYDFLATPLQALGITAERYDICHQPQMMKRLAELRDQNRKTAVILGHEMMMYGVYPKIPQCNGDQLALAAKKIYPEASAIIYSDGETPQPTISLQEALDYEIRWIRFDGGNDFRVLQVCKAITDGLKLPVRGDELSFLNPQAHLRLQT